MPILEHGYANLLSHFPGHYHSLVSLVVLAILVLTLVQLIRKSWLYLLLLLIFVPAAIPVMSSLGQGILEFLRYIANQGQA